MRCEHDDSEALRRQLRKKKRMRQQFDSTHAPLIKTVRMVGDPLAANELIEDVIALEEEHQGSLAD